MDKLPSLPNVQRISKRMLRILGQNPTKFTLQGTNTYLIGTRPPYVLIDTGEGLPAYATLLESTLADLKQNNSTPQLVSDIVLSHWHRDHVGGLPDVLSILQRLSSTDSPFQPPRLHKYPLSQEPEETQNGSPNTLPSILDSLPKDLYIAAPNGKPLHPLSHDQVLSCPETTLRVIHTPGHTEDSIALLVEEDKALYTADTVLGLGTAVFEDLSAYISSLRLMLDDGYGYDTLYPAHGPTIEGKGRETINEYIEHRMQREVQVIEVLKKGACTTWDIVTVLYAAYPKNLWLPAAHGIHLHLEKLRTEGKVEFLGGEGVDAKWAWKSGIMNLF